MSGLEASHTDFHKLNFVFSWITWHPEWQSMSASTPGLDPGVGSLLVASHPFRVKIDLVGTVPVGFVNSASNTGPGANRRHKKTISTAPAREEYRPV